MEVASSIVNEHLRFVVCCGYLLSAVVDTLTGLFAGVPISLVYKALLTIVACATLNATNLRIVVAVFFFYVASVLYTAIVHRIVGLDYIWALRNLMLLAATLFFLELMSSNRRHHWEKWITLFCVVALLVFAGNVLLGVMGVGASQYGSPDGYSAGGKGFIVAGNEMVTAMLAISGILILSTSHQAPPVRICLYAFMTGILILSGTKSGILGLLILIGVREAVSSDSSYVRSRIMLGLLAFVVWFSIDTMVDTFVGRRFIWFLETEGLIRALLSNRDFWALGAISEFVNTANGLDYLLGIGAQIISTANTGKPIVEMDIVDFFVTYGVIGVVVSHLVFYIAIKAAIAQHVPRMVPLVSILLFAALSMFTGHVLNGGTSAAYLAAFLAVSAYTRVPSVQSRGQSHTQLSRTRR